jgi:hypothetical protein
MRFDGINSFVLDGEKSNYIYLFENLCPESLVENFVWQLFYLGSSILKKLKFLFLECT